MRDYNKIKAFQKADDLVIKIYETTRTWPKDELFGLTSQVRRAAVSVASNIVEGSGRRHLTDYLHFLEMAYTSLREVGYDLHVAHRLAYVNRQRYAELEGMHGEAIRTLWGLMEAIASQKGRPLAPEMLREEHAEYEVNTVDYDRSPATDV